MVPSAFASAMDAGRTALHWAAAYGHSDVCQLLLENSASVDAIDGSGDTPFLLAAAHGRAACLHALATAGANAEHVNKFGMNALHHAAWQGHAEAIAELIDKLQLKKLLEDKDCAGHSPLHVAVFRDHLVAVQKLISEGASISSRSACGYTPLHYSTRLSSPLIFSALVAAGANEAALDDDGFTATETVPWELWYPASSASSQESSFPGPVIYQVVDPSMSGWMDPSTFAAAQDAQMAYQFAHARFMVNGAYPMAAPLFPTIFAQQVTFPGVQVRGHSPECHLQSPSVHFSAVGCACLYTPTCFDAGTSLGLAAVSFLFIS